MWLSLILALLKLVDVTANWMRENQLMDAGADKAIAEASASILVKTKARDEIYNRILNESESDIDKELEGQEPK